MAIGGPMWQKSQAMKSQGLGYGQQLRSNFIATRRAQVAALGNKLFSTNINAGFSQTQLAFQLASSRMQTDFEAVKNRINSTILDAGLGSEVDVLA